MAGFIMCEIRGTSMGISVDQIAKETVILGKKTKKKKTAEEAYGQGQ